MLNVNQKKKEKEIDSTLAPLIVFDDDDILVIDKPSGWITNDSQTTEGRPTVQKWIEKSQNYSLARDREYRSGIVHRLDKETSGLLILAKNKNSFHELQSQFKLRKVHKTYTALVHGRVEGSPGKIAVPVGRLPWNRERFGVLPGGRSSETKYDAKAYYSDKNESYTLMQLKPKTGRTHQIRIHMKYIHHPIVSDNFYAGRKTSRNDRKWCSRLFLHASEISIIHPKSLKRISLSTDLPKDLQEVLNTLALV